MDSALLAAAAAEREAVQRALLRRNRTMATALLLLAAALHVGLRMLPDPGFAVRLALAGSEAAVIGALADWFAVTALFRHPLGLPIPHTAIVPNNQGRIGEGLRHFVERHFLDPAIVAEKLRLAEPVEVAAHWLRQPDNAHRLAASVVAAGPDLIRAVENDDLRRFVSTAFGRQLREVAISPMLGKAIALLLSSGQHRPLVERIVAAGIVFIDRHEGQLQVTVEQKSAWWMPKSVDRRISHSVVESLKQMLRDLLDPASPASRELDAAVAGFARGLENSAAVQAQFEQLKNRVVEQPEIERWIQELWTRLRDETLGDLESADSRTTRWVASSLQSIGETLENDSGLRAKLNALIQQMPYGVIEPTRDGVGRFLVAVVRSWDARTISDKVELALGADLQYVRISGTIVAAIVGSALFLLTELTG